MSCRRQISICVTAVMTWRMRTARKLNSALPQTSGHE